MAYTSLTVTGSIILESFYSCHWLSKLLEQKLNIQNTKNGQHGVLRYTRFREVFWKLVWDSWPIRVRLADRSVCLSIKLRAKCGRIGVNGHPIFTFSQNDRVVETNRMVLKAKMYLLSFRIQFLGHFFSMASHGQHCVHEPKTTLKSLICCFVLQPSPSAHSLD